MNRPYYHVTTKTLCALVARGFLDAPLRRVKYKVLDVTAYYDTGSLTPSETRNPQRFSGFCGINNVY